MHENNIRPESRFLPTPPAFDAPPPLQGRFPSEYRHPVWHGKTRMAWLPDGEKVSKIFLFVLTQLTNVTNTQTDTAWRHRPRLCIASRGKNRCVELACKTDPMVSTPARCKRLVNVTVHLTLPAVLCAVSATRSGRQYRYIFLSIFFPSWFPHLSASPFLVSCRKLPCG